MTWINAVVAATALFLTPFGNVSELVQKQNPWHGFFSDSGNKTQGPVVSSEPLLWVVRGQEVESGDCSLWVSALENEKSGVPIRPTVSAEDFTEAWKAWGPWDEEDLDSVKNCDDFPCKVKLNEPEVIKMATATQELRQDRFYNLVKDRVVRYSKTMIHPRYEFSGEPADVWMLFEKRGFVTSLPRSPEIDLSMRKLDFAPGRIRPIRQVLDRRFKKSADGNEAVAWLRDVYTDHYFDSWGEFTSIQCKTNSAGKKTTRIQVVQALLVELDLLKKGDIISKMMRGKMRNAIEENGYAYLDRAFSRLQTQSSQKIQIDEKTRISPTDYTHSPKKQAQE